MPKYPFKKKASRKTKAVRMVPYKPEMKFYDTGNAAGAIPAGPASVIVSSINLVVNGAGPSARIGRKIRVHKIEYAVSLLCNFAAPLATDTVQFDLWLDRSANGTAPTPVQLYTAALVPGTNQYPNLFNEERFKRLHTEEHIFQPQPSIGAASAQALYKMEGVVKCNYTIEFTGSTGAVADIASNNLVPVYSSDNGYCALNAAFYRIHYTDA